MNTNLLAIELRKNALSLLLWMIAIVVLISVTMSMFRTFFENQSKVMGMMSLIPKGALQFKGISNPVDMLSVLGFYAVNNIIYMMVLGSIFSIVLSSNILLKEEYHKTAEYLMTRPITRGEIFNTKLTVVLLYILLLNLVASLAGIICIELVKKGSYNISAFMILSMYTLMLNLLFGAMGIFLSTLIRKPKPITTFAIALVLVFYFIFTLSKITESASRIGYLSPFKYVNTNVGDPAYSLDYRVVLYFTGLSVILLLFSSRLYRRKDIYV